MEVIENTPNIIGNCRIIKKIGEGGMGAVYKAEHTTLGREVAIKLLPVAFAQSEESIERFLREARAAAQLKHPNIVPVFDAGTQNGQYYITMEFVNGTSLGGLLTTKGIVSEHEALQYLLQAARGLGAAHAAGLIHRDIKPDNLLLNKEGEVKIADFGLVSDNTKKNGLTQSGAMLGTPSYMSPEQCNGQRADERSDLYSLGATFYRLITGHAPYQAPTPIAVLYKHLHEPTPDPRTINPTISEWFATLLQQLMAKRPEARIQSAEQLLCILESTNQGVEPTVLAHNTPPPIRSEVTPSAVNAIAGQSTLLTPASTPSFMQQQKPSATIIPNNKWGRLLTSIAILLMLASIGTFAFYAFHKQIIDDAKRDAFDLAARGKYAEAITLLDRTFKLYPEQTNLQALRNSYQATSVTLAIEALKNKAHSQKELKQYAGAIESYENALNLQKQHSNLTELKPDTSLVELMQNTQYTRDYEHLMSQGRKTEELRDFPAAIAAYEKAMGLETTLGIIGSRAQKAKMRATFTQLMANAKASEAQAQYTSALAFIVRASELNLGNVSSHQQRIQNRIQFEHLLDSANLLSDKGEFLQSANTLKQATPLAPDASAATRLQKRILKMTTEAHYVSALSEGHQAFAKKNWTQALASFRKAQRVKPDEILAEQKIKQTEAMKYLELGTKSFDGFDWPLAEKHWKNAIRLSPKNPIIIKQINALKAKRLEIQRMEQAFQKQRTEKNWQASLKQLEVLMQIDPQQSEHYKRLENSVHFASGIAEARAFQANGQLEAAENRAQQAQELDPTGGEQARALIAEIQAQRTRLQQAADIKTAQNTALTLVREGTLQKALTVLAQATQKFPGNDALRNSWIALQAVDAIEGSFRRLVELQQDAEASAQSSSDQKKKKDIQEWLGEIKEWKTALAAQSDSARTAWLNSDFSSISQHVQTMKDSAKAMAQSFSGLAANFRGKAASTAKPKARIGGFSFGGRHARGGGFGASGNIGGDTKRAAIYDSTAATLRQCASEARRIGSTH